VLVDSDRAAADLGRRNLASMGLADAGRVAQTTVAAFLALPPPAEAPFTLVTLDAPYATPSDEIEAALRALTAPGWVAPDATAVVERSLRTPVDPVPPGWRLRFARAYGDTLVTLLTAGESDPAN
jgi:16S rRNA (guanine966-N2)-methyltransferase